MQYLSLSLSLYMPTSGGELTDALPRTHTHSFRPHLIAQLHEELGPPCSQCGRRFRMDDEGRRRKTAHMDWHFRAHQRLAEAEKRGQHRSWYVDEMVGLVAPSSPVKTPPNF